MILNGLISMVSDSSYSGSGVCLRLKEPGAAVLAWACDFWRQIFDDGWLEPISLARNLTPRHSEAQEKKARNRLVQLRFEEIKTAPISRQAQVHGD